MTAITYTEAPSEITGTRCTVTGEAVFTARLEHGLNSDVGGRDGWEVTICELARFELDGVHLTRDQVQSIMGKDALAGWEESTSNFIDANRIDWLEGAA